MMCDRYQKITVKRPDGTWETYYIDFVGDAKNPIVSHIPDSLDRLEVLRHELKEEWTLKNQVKS